MGEKSGEQLICKHCGDICPDDSIRLGNDFFCCNGCLFVYELLRDKNMSDYYDIAKESGIAPQKPNAKEFEFLDDVVTVQNLLLFDHKDTSIVKFYVPQVYCSACIWLLENLNRLSDGINTSEVNFLKKEITINFNNKEITLRQIVELLTTIGYRPELNLADLGNENRKNSVNKGLYLKLGIAGFVFGNIMLLALPEYLSDGKLDPDIRSLMSYLNLIFLLPILYSASDYFKSAFTALKVKHINIDVPISIGVIVLLLRSIYEITTGIGPGYVDSMSGLIFFLLIGKVFQQKTYHNLSFSRDYKSYFPLSVIKLMNGEENYVSINQLVTGDTLLIRNNEIIPADAILLSQEAHIDYSFVTGESKPIEIQNGDRIYSGGKQIGKSIKISLVKDFKQSYLTDLWDNKGMQETSKSKIKSISDTAAKYFTIIVLVIAFTSFFYWMQDDLKTALNAFTAVLIIACPCAIALTVPFTYGTALRIFGKYDFFLKNDGVIEKIAKVDHVILDKTGTLTDIEHSEIVFDGKELSVEEISCVYTLTSNSTHPLSVMIHKNLDNVLKVDIHSFNEVPSMGIEAIINDKHIKLGKKEFVSNLLNPISTKNREEFQTESTVYLSIDGVYRGRFLLKSKYRDGLKIPINDLIKDKQSTILSGDNNSEEGYLRKEFPQINTMLFSQLPDQKLEYVNKLHNDGKVVIMIGDGLNDAGALNSSDVGIAVTEKSSNFTPGSDAIIISSKLNLLSKFVDISKSAVNIVWISYGISFLYNIIGFTYAVQGLLSPVVAAILMPISSISVVIFTVGSISLIFRRKMSATSNKF